MKRILIALALLACVQIAGAQVKAPAAAAKAVEKAEVASKDPKKAAKVATWTKLAQAYMDAYDSPAGNAMVGISEQELSLLMASEKPTSTENVVLEGAEYVKKVYANKDLYFQNGVLAMIIITKPVLDDPLAKALEAYKEAYAVDTKQSKLKDIVTGIEKIKNNYTKDAFNAYQIGDLAGASDYFAKSAAASKVEPYAQLDSIALYNAGFTAWMIKDYEKAKVYFEDCLSNNYYHQDGDVFSRLSDVYTNLGDAENSVKILEEGFIKCPQSQGVLIGLINHYIKNNEDTERLFELINLAKANDPKNASLYYVEGNVYAELRKASLNPENLADVNGYEEKAIAVYDQSSAINPDFEYGHIGKGVMYYNIADELTKIASDPNLPYKQWNEVAKLQTESYRKAFGPFETAFNMTKDEALKQQIALFLREICYRLYEEGAEWQQAYEKYNEIVKAGNAQ